MTHDSPVSQAIHLSSPRMLRAGPLTMLYDDGDIRYVKLGDHEIIRRVYGAVRDRNWGTVAGIRSAEQLAIGEETFTIHYTVEHRQDDIAFDWHCTISGSAEGVVRFRMGGQARTTFLRNRIGLCILHPIDQLAGAACVVEHMDGSRHETRLPLEISADQPVEPFSSMRALRYEVAPGMWAELRFTGEIFEIEDQRNWTDASLKTFSTPFHLPVPVEIPAGTRIEQEVTLGLHYDAGADQDLLANRDTTIPPLVLSVDLGKPQSALPALGLGMASHGETLDEGALQLLQALHPAHLRVDVDATSPHAAARLEQAASEAQALGALLEVALLLPDEPETALARLQPAINRLGALAARYLVFHTRRQPTPDALAAAAQVVIPEGIPIAVGSNSDFFFANAGPLPSAPFELLTFAINPQAHAFDDASVMETLSTQAVVVENARRIAGSKPVIVSPVTLRPRFNPYATGAGSQQAPNTLPPEVDARQRSQFGAAWTLGSIAYLAQGGATSITMFETTGWRGVIETAHGSPMPELFASQPGEIFPVYRVLAELAEWIGAQVCAATPSDPLRLAGLALRHNGQVGVFVANLTPRPQLVSVRGVPAGVVRLELDGYAVARVV